MTVGALHGGMWFRASRYEIGDGVIRPAMDASVELYDPWQLHIPAGQRRRHADGEAPRSHDDVRPYQTLLRLAHQLRDPETGIPSVEPSPDQERQILEWCRRNGLLGILPHQVDTVLFPAVADEPLPPEDAGHDAGSFGARATSYGYRRASLGWENLEIPVNAKAVEKPASRDEKKDPGFYIELPIPSTVLPDPQSGGVIYRSLPDGALHEDELDGEWSLFFRDKVAAVAWPFPAFSDADFWRIYGEPLGWFVAVACQLGDAVAMLDLERAGRVSAQQSRAWRLSALAQINAVAAMASPAIRSVGSSDIELRWTTPSLLASYALMLQIDLAGGANVRTCEHCGAPFVITTDSRAYCTPTCRTTTNKRTQRARKRRALELAGKGWTSARIAAEVGAKDAATVQRWIDKARSEGRLQ